MTRARIALAGKLLVGLGVVAVIALTARSPEPPPLTPVDSAAMNQIERCTRAEFDGDAAYARCRYDRARARLALVPDPRARGPYLGQAALTALDAGFPDDARRYAAEARTLVAEQSGSRLGGHTSDAEEHAAIVEGRLALAAGDTATARARLLDAGSVLASPTQTSFGPNTSLARDLIAAGDTTIVRAYFDTIGRTWPAQSSAEPLRQWRAALDRGEMPDFRAHLIY